MYVNPSVEVNVTKVTHPIDLAALREETLWRLRVNKSKGPASWPLPWSIWLTPVAGEHEHIVVETQDDINWILSTDHTMGAAA